MKNRAIVKGGLLVALGASSYGMLTTFVKMAYEEGFTTAEVTFSQLLLGFIGLLVLNLFVKGKKKTSIRNKTKKHTKKKVAKLILAGAPLGLTSIFYYSAVQYISVSLGIVLLMQSVWMGVVLDAVAHKKAPSKLKWLSVGIILFGTLLATNIFMEPMGINWKGIGFGLLAAVSYTLVIFVSSRVATNLPSLVRSQWMVLGGFIVVALVMLPALLSDFNMEIFYKWGPVLALFGAILPPLLLTSGMPKINMGTGAIVSSLELPVAVLMAFFLLGEKVTIYQWIGIVLILFSIVLMNYRKATR